MKENNGSIGVVEMSVILPLTISICLFLVYFMFSFFSYAYTYCVADKIVDCFEDNLSSKSLYWYVLSNSYDQDQLDFSTDKANELLSKTLILPGANYKFNAQIKKEPMKTRLEIYIDYYYFKKKEFSIVIKRDVVNPVEFVVLSEFATNNEELENDIENIKEVLGEFIK